MENFLPYFNPDLSMRKKMELILWQGRSVGLGKHLEFPAETDV